MKALLKQVSPFYIMETVKNNWLDLLRSYTANEKLISRFWQEIYTAYAQKGRYYHTLNHIAQMLESTKKYQGRLLDIKNINLSIFYHDAVYSVY